MDSLAPVKKSPFDPIAVAQQLVTAAQAAGFRVEPFGEMEGCPLFALTRRRPGMRPKIYLSAGIHGDEPAGPLALLELIAAGYFDDRANWFLCPLLNPTGLVRGTRENIDGVDLNRDYREPRAAETRAHISWLRRQPNFDLTLCLHEDWESTGFYLYELNRAGRPTLADRMIAAVITGCPLEPATVIDGREIDAPGIIRPHGDPLERELWAEAIYLHAHHTKLGYTLETPSALAIEVRVAALRRAVAAAGTGI